MQPHMCVHMFVLTSAHCFRRGVARLVATHAGTGLVHTAPGHGAEDYQVSCEQF
jgi:isoleucyl-tRNA synthetase